MLQYVLNSAVGVFLVPVRQHVVCLSSVRPSSHVSTWGNQNASTCGIHSTTGSVQASGTQRTMETQGLMGAVVPNLLCFTAAEHKRATLPIRPQ